MIRTKTIKPNIEKYIFLYSDHARKTNYIDTNGVEKTFDEKNEELNDVLRVLEKTYPSAEIDLADGTITYQVVLNTTALSTDTFSVY